MTESTSQPLEPDDPAGTVLVYTVDPCAPCEMVKGALKLLDADIRRLGWTIRIVATELSDKKAVGAAFLAGVKQFPTVRLVRDGRVLKSFAGVREGWTPQDVASFLRSAIEAEGANAEPVANEVPAAR